MLVQCENCRTIFNLDETILKESGSRVRCSRCRHLFMAYPPTPQAEDAAKEEPSPPEPVKEEVADGLILRDEEEWLPPTLGKDEAFEADLENVYKDALIETDLDLEKDEEMPQETRQEEKEAGRKDEREVPDRDIEPLAKAVSKKERAKSNLRVVLLTLLLMILAGAAAIAYLKPELIQPYISLLKIPEKEKPAEPGVRLLQFESVAGSFVDSEKGGQLFVIRGMVHSQYPNPRSYILIKGAILDNKGKAVESRVAYAGNTFTEEELKTIPIEEILKAMQNRDGMARQNFNVPSGTSIPFIIVFDNLPDNLSEFAVEAVSSSPGA
jgi:predicted Zn finger-like uncharacterized protein